MLINREWKHSFESYPSNSVTSLVSVWDLMFDKDGYAWFDQYIEGSTDTDGNPLSPDVGCHLEHDLICFNKKLYQSTSTQSETINIQSDIRPQGDSGILFDTEFEKHTNEWLYGTFGIDIAIPFYSPSSRAEEKEINNKTFLKFDKNAVIPYKNLRTFTINSLSMNNAWGWNPKVRQPYIEPTYCQIFQPPKVGPYDETLNPNQLREIGFDIWLKGKNTQFTKDNEIDENLEAYNYICIDPLSSYGKMLIVRAISENDNVQFTRANQPISDKNSYAGIFTSVEDIKAYKEILEKTYVWIRAPFFADYVKPNSYNQNLNKDSRVVHRDLIVSETGDFNEYNEFVGADELIPSADENEPGTNLIDNNHNWIDTLPYISQTAPILDFIRPEKVKDADGYDTNTDFDESFYELIKNSDNWFNKYDIAGIPIPSSLTRLEEDNQSYAENAYCPFIYWNTEFMEEPDYLTGDAHYKYSSFFTKGRLPTFIKKHGNIYADGRIFSPTIDELWTAYKEFVCGRNDISTEKDIALPFGTNEYKLQKNHIISYDNIKNGWLFKLFNNYGENGEDTFYEDGRTFVGDPLKFRMGYYTSEGDYRQTEVSDFINHNNTISYKIFSSIINLNNTLRKVITGDDTDISRKNIDYDSSRKPFFYLGKPYNELPTYITNNEREEYEDLNVSYGEAPSDSEPTDRDTVTWKKHLFGPRPSPYSLRELEALVKGNRYNIDTLAIWLKKNTVINSKVSFRYADSTSDNSYSNEAKSGLYQLHKDYDGEFSDNTQFIQNKETGGFLQFDDNIKFATQYTLRKNFSRRRINFAEQNKIDTSQVFLAADGTWRYIFEKPRTQIVQTTR